nr:substrate-binding domain-containing protein [Kibdelosporangium sp. MJ126-NF4]
MSEPRLQVRRPQAPPLLRRGFLRVFLPTAAVAIAGVAILLAGGTAALPFQPLTVLQGKMGSKEDYFNDPEVQRILLRHHIRVHVTSMGSRDVATTGLDGYDFVFPSGQPTAELVQRRTTGNPDVKPHRPVLTSPLVLATYRRYAEALIEAKVARKQPDSDLYFDVDVTGLGRLMREPKTWQDIGLRTNRNPITVHTSSVCTSNGGGNFLGLLAYVENKGQPIATEQDVDRVADLVAPLVRGAGLPLKSPKQTYFAADGAATAPITVLYEHQYLQYQAQAVRATGKPDPTRVLLYPDTSLMTEPGFISLNPDGRRLGTLLETDLDLRRRAVELGFRVVAADDVPNTPTLTEQLASDRVPAPVDRTDDTKALLPASIDLFERLIVRVGQCPS